MRKRKSTDSDQLMSIHSEEGLFSLTGVIIRLCHSSQLYQSLTVVHDWSILCGYMQGAPLQTTSLGQRTSMTRNWTLANADAVRQGLRHPGPSLPVRIALTI